MSSISYISTSGAQRSLTMPKPGAVSVVNGQFTKETWRYLNSLSGTPPVEVAITVGASPTTFTAPGIGTLLVSGGTGVSVNLNSRQNTTGNANAPTPASYAVPVGLIPMSQQDSVSITYTGVPTCIWFPK